MKKYKLGEMEQKFANLIWAKAPIKTHDLIILCAEEFNWKRTTTYTMLKRLCDRGIFDTDQGCVSVLINKEDYIAEKSEEFLLETFDGSVPKFLAAFTKSKKLTKKDLNEIQSLIDKYNGG